ncbi:hypothetical protein [Streptacidiphilus sp. EB129]|uniref:hypothetical protein n=1 Tax=Streptacidiphilus sp. EB129 TaxID=3156262 RepID=UPI0035110E88
MTPVRFVLDDTALVALGSGSRQASALVHRASTDPGIDLVAPTLCMLAAEDQRVGVAEHIGMLEVVRIGDLDFPGLMGVADFARSGMSWQAAHGLYMAQPAIDFPGFTLLATVEPDRYPKQFAEIFDISD